MTDIEMTVANGETYMVTGLAKYYTQEGVPLAMMAAYAKERGVKISWLNLADELIKSGFSSQKILSELREVERFVDVGIDMNAVESFTQADYVGQREMLRAYWDECGFVHPMNNPIAIAPDKL